MKNKEKIKTKLPHKLLMIFLSIIITLFILEISLRMIGFFYLQQRENTGKNADDLKGNNLYTVLCIGESTTAGVVNPEINSNDISYPTLLYKTLKKEKPDLNLKVINDGIPGATTFTLLTRLEGNLDKYKPDLVICMIGTNDTGMTVSYDSNFFNKAFSLLYKLKILKIFVQGPLKFLKYHKKINVFERDKNSVDQYFRDKFGHYTIEIEPSVFLKKRGFPLNDANLRKSIEHYNNGRIKDALTEAEAAVKKHPDDISTRLYISEIYYGMSDYDRAIGIYSDVLAKKTDDPVIFVKLAKCHEMKNDFKEAEKIYRLLTEKWQDDYDVNIAMISLLMIKYEIFTRVNYPENQRREVYNEIAALCNKCITLEPENLLGHFQLGRFYMSTGEIDNAISSLKTAYRLENKKNYRGYFDFNEQPARYLADCYERAGLAPKTLEVLQPLAKQYDNPVIIKYLANLYLRLNDIQNAETLFQRAEKIESGSFVSSYRDNYRLICKTILDRKCKMAAMEHPLRSIAALKKILEDFDGVTFVSNELNFKKALEKESFSTFFIDIYAGDFGHCTERGNMLIVDNLKQIIINEYK